MIENLTISVSFSEVEEAHISNYFRLSEMSGEFLIIQRSDNTFYFLCTNNCDIVSICQSFDWYIVSKDTFNDHLIIGIGLSDKESINGELYRVQDETTLTLWRDILHFTFESDFVRQFFPYNTHFKGKMRIDGALCFYIHDYYPTRCKDISVSDRKTSNLVFRFKEGRHREQMKGTHGQDKLSNLIFHPDYFKGRDVFLIDDIISSGENFTQMKCKLIQLGAKSVTGLFLGKTIKSENQK